MRALASGSAVRQISGSSAMGGLGQGAFENKQSWLALEPAGKTVWGLFVEAVFRECEEKAGVEVLQAFREKSTL